MVNGYNADEKSDLKRNLDDLKVSAQNKDDGREH